MDTRRFGTSLLSKFYCDFVQIDSELVQPTMRSGVEEQLNLIALGKVYIAVLYMWKILMDIKSV